MEDMGAWWVPHRFHLAWESVMQIADTVGNIDLGVTVCSWEIYLLWIILPILILYKSAVEKFNISSSRGSLLYLCR